MEPWPERGVKLAGAGARLEEPPPLHAASKAARLTPATYRAKLKVFIFTDSAAGCPDPAFGQSSNVVQS
jgi:hypothetical protein